MTFLKWEIYETQGVVSRNSVKSLSDEEFAMSVIKWVDWGYSLEDVYETRYHITSREGD